MQNPLLVPEIRECLANNDAKTLQELCAAAHPAVIAEFLSGLGPQEIWQVLRHLDSHLRADIFGNMEDNLQAEAAALLKRDELVSLVTDMPPDERVDLLKRMPREVRKALLPAMAHAEREDIRRLSSYPEGTAGSIMTSEYATLHPNLTVGRAIAKLRQEGPDKETIYYAYVIADGRKLEGFVSLKDLILARTDARIADIMHRDAIFVRVTDDQEEAARKIQKYDLLALPVVDADDALVGIITHDDALDVITQEQTEDLEKLMAISGTHEPMAYLRTSAWAHFRNRCVWIVVLAALGLVSGFIVQSFEGLLLQFGILATFMPMLADTGGNTGSQSATLVVRALALKEVSPRDIVRILWKELRVSVLLALVLALVAVGRTLLFAGGSTMPAEYSAVAVGLAVALALALQVVTATLIGALLPLGASALKFDPAVVASPAVTTIVDISGLLIYFVTVKTVLGL